jgi:hypothetical protein
VYQLSGRSPPRKARRHLLKKPAVAVRITERGKRAIGLVLWSRTRSACLSAGVVEHPTGVVEHLAHLDATVDQLGPGCLDIGDDELQTFSRARCGRGDPTAEDDRARRARRRQLHDPEAAVTGEIGVQAPPQRLIEALGPVYPDTGTTTTSSFMSTTATPSLEPIATARLREPVIAPLVVEVQGPLSEQVAAIFTDLDELFRPRNCPAAIGAELEARTGCSERARRLLRRRA